MTPLLTASAGTATPATIELKFTVFLDTSGSQLVSRKATWGDVVRRLLDPQVRPTKQDCHLIKLATFGDLRSDGGSLRNDANVLEIYGIEGDYDAQEIGVDEAARRLTAAGIEAFIYTTAKHSPLRPRWRVLAPLSKPCPRDGRRAFVGMLNAALGGILATESFTASQTYYFGRVEGVPYETSHVLGRPIDLPDPSLKPIYTTGQTDQTPPCDDIDDGSDLDRQVAISRATSHTIEELRSALAAIPADDRVLWVRMSLALASLKGTDLAEDARVIWLRWSESSVNHDPDSDPDQWESFVPDRTYYRAVFAEAARHGWVNPRSARTPSDAYLEREDRTDAGNANVLIRISDGNLRCVPERKVWLEWDGQCWTVDQHGAAAQRAALGVAKHNLVLAAEKEEEAKDPALSDTDKKRLLDIAVGYVRWAGSCRSKHAIDAMLGVASRDIRVQLGIAELDRDPSLLGVSNGVVDLRTGQLRPGARDDFVTKRCNGNYRPGADAPNWTRFIGEITGLGVEPNRDPSTGVVRPETVGRYTPRPEMATYLQRALGYSLTGSVAEHKMLIAIGDGSNGKNVLLDTFQEIGGPYTQTIPPEALMASRGDADAERPSPVLASLAGVRAAISSESKDGQRLDVGLIKRHTGGGFMTARLMRENTFRFLISHKLWLMTNHRPSLDHLDEALRGRLHMIRFERRWNRPGHSERDPGLPDGDKDLMAKLRAESEGVLAWLVAGAVDYFKHGLEPPQAVVRSTQAYFLEEDDLGRWLAQRKTCAPESGMAAAVLYQDYRNWCAGEGVDTDSFSSQKSFSTALRGRGIPSKKLASGQHYGLRLPNPLDGEYESDLLEEGA